ncbi:MAG: Micrococcal nuclease [Parcubacteria group bacterium GW2011_GWA1_47_8]|nr:MAG: Micrococcal nuclease [Parcubacteria group bacterium GW2011_GWA1_47_8]KKW07568.1 MAG: Micrococcal nuclease [Parcubacteria group bacterium GW2011_GWA2_49_16]
MSRTTIVVLVSLALLTFAGEKLSSKASVSDDTILLTQATTTQKEAPLADPSLIPVARVVDGDTIIVRIHNVDEKVRLIGVDTPETVDPRKTVQCFGKEASQFVTSLLENKSVRLEPDPTQGDRDHYGRLLRYVFLPDGTLLNRKIIAQGYGHEYTYRLSYQYQQDFKNAERQAREHEKGLWAVGTCGN